MLKQQQDLEILIKKLASVIEADGGTLTLTGVNYDTGVVNVLISGACESCALSTVTLYGGIERVLKSRLPWVVEVIGSVDSSLTEDESSALGAGYYVPKT